MVAQMLVLELTNLFLLTFLEAKVLALPQSRYSLLLPVKSKSDF